MEENPLQSHFRQPKIYISLPSKGIYNKLGTIKGDPTHIPVYGMTGMDEIMMRTPDALLSGETTVSLYESCVPSIVDGWEVTTLDTDLLLVAIRIASNGEFLPVTHVCSNPECKTENEYDVSLTKVIDHFNNCKYNNTVKINELSVKIQPLTYRESTKFSLTNFELQQQMSAATKLEGEEQKTVVADLFKQLGQLQNDIYTACVESVDTGTTVVTEKNFIKDWIVNCDKDVFAVLREHFNSIKETWRIPTVKVKCDECGTEVNLSIDLDQSSFFVKA